MTRENFTRLFKQLVFSKGLTHLEVATRLQIGIPTVSRWIDGQSCPHEFGRTAIIQTMRKW